MKLKNKLFTSTLLALAVLAVPVHADESILQKPSVELTEDALVGNYDLQLYFGNTQPFLDTVHLKRGAENQLEGDMHVPDDFDGPLLNLQSSKVAIRFEILVPKNRARPDDMVFLYEATISPHDTKNFAGHVTLTKVGAQTLEKPEYIASFLMFKK